MSIPLNNVKLPDFLWDEESEVLFYTVQLKRAKVLQQQTNHEKQMEDSLLNTIIQSRFKSIFICCSKESA